MWTANLHTVLVFATEDIEPIRVTRAKYYAALSLRWVKKNCRQTSSHFRLLVVLGFPFYCLFVYSVQALGLLFSIFGEFQAPSIGLEYELQCVESFPVDPFVCKYSWNNAKESSFPKKDCFGTCGRGLRRRSPVAERYGTSSWRASQEVTLGHTKTGWLCVNWLVIGH